MEREIVRGIVRKIENINKYLSFITIRTIEDESYKEIRVPFYMQVGEKYQGRVVDIITERKGLFKRKIKQTIHGADISSTIERPSYVVKCISDSYKKLENKL
jgi:hypothetical protein